MFCKYKLYYLIYGFTVARSAILLVQLACELRPALDGFVPPKTSTPGGRFRAVSVTGLEARKEIR
jgi:hypothetical protein